MNRIILSFLLTFTFQFCFAQSKLIQVQGKSFQKVDLFEVNSSSRNGLPIEVKNYSILKLKADKLSELLSNRSSQIELSIPTINRSNMDLLLEEVTFDDLTISTSDQKRVKYKPGRHFRGIIKGDENSIVAISLFDNDVMGLISSERFEGNMVLGKIKDSQEDYILYEDKDVLASMSHDCATPDGVTTYTEEDLHNSHNRALSDCVRMYFEVDNNIYTGKGSNTTTVTNYVTGLYNQVAALYTAEQIKTVISEIFIWTTSSPYSGSSSSTMLNQFTAYRNGFNGNIAMLLSYSASGGIAYVNTLCNSNPDYRMSFASIGSSYSTVPTYSWSVEVVTHEFGHLLGSQHTHACAWNGNNTAIDGCYSVEGSCANPGIPSGGGTIMSYCHLTSTGINFSKGFGTQPGNVIRNKVSTVTCLTACPSSGTPTCTDGIQNGQETGIDCGGPTCSPCASGCSTNSGTLTLVLDNYPTETTWNIKNSNGVVLYSGGPYPTSASNSTVTVPLCIPNGCYTFNIYDSYGDGICCSWGNGSYNVVVNNVNQASGGQFTTSQTKSFCINGSGGGSTPTCSDGIQNGNETGIDCGGSCPACPTCNDGIKNGNETGIDCGGSCPACPTCNDGIKNGNETGIDCGGSCPACSTCNDGVQNGQETGVDCGGPTCPPCNNGGGSGSTLGAYYFETGWDSWVSGGEDAIRYQGNRSAEGSWSISIRDDSGPVSTMTSPTYNITNYQGLEIKFSFYAYSMESNEDFFLQYFNGGTWTTIKSWVSGVDFNNNTFYNVTLAISKNNFTFPTNARLRFTCDASTNADVIYIDAVIIKGLATSPIPESNEFVALSAGLETINSEVTIYPNPSYDGQFNILLQEYEDSEVQIWFTDILGKQVKQITKPVGETIISVDSGNLSQGVYIVRSLVDGEIINTEKVILQR